ncbi:hypothetical protein MESS2_760057 [Mesorhizobium metallidurans STM 2683]|uniref:Uncharacterized protein n=1 Tax=Mesorhizobium metallidurans STM 2683 TaxID=1297569 RepID=M5EX27_9HYPH|nr:hypothetical protein MESS2_760057 [Mesorhizobium metallidurans STM 2683]
MATHDAVRSSSLSASGFDRFSLAEVSSTYRQAPRSVLDRRAVIAHPIDQILRLLYGYSGAQCERFDRQWIVAVHLTGLRKRVISREWKCGLALNFLLGRLPVPFMIAVQAAFTFPNCVCALLDFLMLFVAHCRFLRAGLGQTLGTLKRSGTQYRFRIL